MLGTLNIIERSLLNRWLLFLGVSIVLLWASIVSVSRGMGDLYYYPVRFSFDAWEQKVKQPPAEQEYLNIQRLLDTALKWDSRNPLFIESSGRIREGLTQAAVNESSDQLLEKALEDFRLATILMPSSPWAWKNIAITKARLGQYDPVLEKSLLLAHYLGPGRVDIDYSVAEIGLAAWGVLSEAARPQVIESMRQLLNISNTGKLLIEMAEKYHKKDIVCRNFQQHQELLGYCMSYQNR